MPFRYCTQSGYLAKKANNCKAKVGYKKPDTQNHFIADTNVHHQQRTIDLQFHEYDAQIRDGSYPLHMAVFNNAPFEVLCLLVNIGGRETLAFKNKFGKTPYQLMQEQKERRGKDGQSLSTVVYTQDQMQTMIPTDVTSLT